MLYDVVTVAVYIQIGNMREQGSDKMIFYIQKMEGLDHLSKEGLSTSGMTIFVVVHLSLTTVKLCQN